MANSGLNISGIYKIESKVHPERVYIGSAVNILHRWRNHLSDLRKNKHSSKKLQRHYDKHGVEDLTFSVLAICSKKDLIPINGIIWIETFFIHAYRYKDDNKAYFNNVSTGGSNLGSTRSEESRKKNGDAKRGQTGWSKGLTKDTHPSLMESAKKRTGMKRSEETRKRQSTIRKGKFVGENHPMFGKHHKQETKDKLHDANIGKTLPQETKDKMSKVRKGKKMPEGFGEKMSKIMMGNKNGLGVKKSAETIEKLKQANIGKKASPESIKKMSESHKGKKATEEQKKNQSIATTDWWRGVRVEQRVEAETERYFKERNVA